MDARFLLESPKTLPLFKTRHGWKSPTDDQKKKKKKLCNVYMIKREAGGFKPFPAMSQQDACMWCQVMSCHVMCYPSIHPSNGHSICDPIHPNTSLSRWAIENGRGNRQWAMHDGQWAMPDAWCLMPDAWFRCLMPDEQWALDIAWWAVWALDTNGWWVMGDAWYLISMLDAWLSNGPWRMLDGQLTMMMLDALWAMAITTYVVLVHINNA